MRGSGGECVWWLKKGDLLQPAGSWVCFLHLKRRSEKSLTQHRASQRVTEGWVLAEGTTLVKIGPWGQSQPLKLVAQPFLPVTTPCFCP